MNSAPVVSIVIVNYNGLRHLEECFSSIAEQVTGAYEVIVVDNASSDGSVSFISERFPWVRLFAHGENAGFSAGNNLGAAHAKGKYLLLLNNDTRLLGSIQPVFDLMERDAGIGAVGCALSYGDGRLQHSYGYEHTPLRIALSWLGLARFGFLPSVFRRVEVRPRCYQSAQLGVGWVSGAFLATRRELWERLGGMDAGYFMYVEDVDYCKRVRDAGYRIAYLPEVKVVHYEGGGKAWIGVRALKNTFTSYLRYVAKHHGARSCFPFRCALLAVAALRSSAYGIGFRVTGRELYREKSLSFHEVFMLLKGSSHES